MGSFNATNRSQIKQQEHIQILDSDTDDFYSSSQDDYFKGQQPLPCKENTVIDLVPSEELNNQFDNSFDENYGFLNSAVNDQYDSDTTFSDQNSMQRKQLANSGTLSKGAYFNNSLAPDDNLSPLEDFYSLKDAESDDEVALYFKKLYDKPANVQFTMGFPAKLTSPRRKRAFASSSALAHDDYASSNGEAACIKSYSKSSYGTAKRWSSTTSYKRRPRNYTN